MAWPWAPEGMSVDPGADTTWSAGPRLVTEPTAVAVDSDGRPRACGARAVMAAARRGSGLRLARPFTSSSIVDLALARTYLRWVVESAGCGRKRAPLMVVIPAVSPSAVIGSWRDLAESIGGRHMVVERPVAAVAGLALDAPSGTAQMVVDAEMDATEVAVVADGIVIVAYQTPPLTAGLAETAATIRSILISVDPDHELDITDQGIHLVGRQVTGKGVADDLASRVGVAVRVPEDPGRVVIEGARRTMETVRPYLSMVAGGRGRRFGFRAVRDGFAR